MVYLKYYRTQKEVKKMAYTVEGKTGEVVMEREGTDFKSLHRMMVEARTLGYDVVFCEPVEMGDVIIWVE
jgi:hypothetical protein